MSASLLGVPAVMQYEEHSITYEVLSPKSLIINLINILDLIASLQGIEE